MDSLAFQLALLEFIFLEKLIAKSWLAF